MKNKNGYLMYMEDEFGNIISDTYATYEIAFCVMVSRENKLENPAVLTQTYIMDNDTGELLFYADRTTNDLDSHGYMVMWQDKEQKTNDYEYVWFKYEENAMDFFRDYEYSHEVNVMIMEWENEEVISRDEGVYSDYDRIMEWREIYDC